MITNICVTFFEISVSISLMIVLVFKLAPFLNRRYAAKWKYWIWIVLALRLIIPLGGSDGTSVVDIQPQEAGRAGQESEKAPPDMPDNGTVQGRFIVEIPRQMTSVLVEQPEKNRGISVLDIMALVWMSGSLLFLSVHLINYFHYRHQIFKKGKIVNDRDVQCLLVKLKHELNIKCEVSVIRYSGVTSPMLTGFLKPVLVLPDEQYHPRELFFILKHELIHLKYGDICFKFLFLTANAVHWFNPLVWIMQKEAAVDMELTCDERVTQGTSYAVRKAYTETLLSALYKQSAKKTVLSTGFYGGKQIMKKRFKNILAITGKKNGLAVLICAIIFIICMGTPVVCQIAKETVKDAARQPETMDLKTKDDLTENIRTDEPLPESGGDFQRAEQLSGDYAVSTGNMTVALYESKQDITDRLNETGLNYNEYDSDTKYSDPAYNKYDSYYMAGESPLGTNEAQDASLCIYFADGICVRLELLDGETETARGIRKGDSWSGVTEKYGDSYEIRKSRKDRKFCA